MKRARQHAICVCYENHGEHHIWVFDDKTRVEFFKSLGHTAMNPELAFDWMDAAKVMVKARRDAELLVNELCEG